VGGDFDLLKEKAGVLWSDHMQFATLIWGANSTFAVSPAEVSSDKTY
jgi:hypothetical protein